jgi:SAM-dependent methyltransferase
MSEKAEYLVIKGIRCYHPEEAYRFADYPADGFILTDRLEKESFWVRSRNRLLSEIIDTCSKDISNPKFLEVGGGTGEFLRNIIGNKNLQVTGSDIYYSALSFAKKKLPDVEFIQFDVTKGGLNRKYDIIGAFDVLEHIDDDLSALGNIYEMLNYGGFLVVTVPQYKFLWSNIDKIVKHKRRYSRGELLQKLSQKGFSTNYCTSFLFFLFPLMFMTRIMDRRKKMNAKFISTEFAGRVSFPRSLSWTFDKLMRVDEFLIRRRMRLPFGGSLLVVAQKGIRKT